MNTPRLLIVEDDPAYQLSLEMLLEKLGYEYTLRATGEEALDLPHRYDLALLDIHLGGAMNGIELAGHLTAEHNIPVVFLTASEDISIYEKTRVMADSVYLVKPVSELTLISIIETTLRKNSYGMQTGVALPPTEEEKTGQYDFLFLKFKGRTVRIETRDIVYAQADGNYCFLYTDQRRFVIKTSLRKISDKLHPPAFLQIHRSCIARLDCVESVDFSERTVKVKEHSLPLGERFRETLLHRLHRI